MKLVKFTAAIGLALIVIAAEWAIWTSPTTTTPGAIAITGMILIVLAVIIGFYLDVVKEP